MRDESPSLSITITTLHLFHLPLLDLKYRAPVPLTLLHRKPKHYYTLSSPWSPQPLHVSRGSTSYLHLQACSTGTYSQAGAQKRFSSSSPGVRARRSRRSRGSAAVAAGPFPLRIGGLWIHEGFCELEVRLYLPVAVKSGRGLFWHFRGGIPFNELGRRYADGACMNRIALVSEVGVAVEGAPDCCLRTHRPGDMEFIPPLSCLLFAIIPL